jgi:hypothetical protein
VTGRLRSALATALLFLSVLLWLALMATVAGMHQSDVAGNSLSWSFAILMTLGLWLLLIGLGFLAGRAALPAWLRGTGPFLYPLSGAATIAAINLFRDQDRLWSTWPIALPVLLPILLMLSCARVLSPPLGARVSPATADLMWTGIVVLSLAPWPFLILQNRARQSGTAIQHQVHPAHATIAGTPLSHSPAR